MTKFSGEHYGNTYDNSPRKGVRDTTPKTTEDSWQRSGILPKDQQPLSIEKSLATEKLIPPRVAEPSTV